MKSKFGHPMVFPPGFHKREFTLVVSYYRATFKLDVHTVSVALHSCFGGYPQGFHVKFLKDRSFHFLVASKAVGFDIYNAGRIVELDFELVFNLWGNGGPNWLREESLFYKEEDVEWTLVGRNGRVVPSLTAGDHRNTTLVVKTISVFQHLSRVDNA